MGQEVQPIKTSFNAGELSPRLFGRVDISKYSSGCALLENFIVLAHGGIKRRPGTRFVQEVIDSSKKNRLLPFIFNEDQSYVLDFGNLTLRFFTQNGILTETAKNITAATKADPVVITSNSHGYANGDQVVIAGVVGMTELNSGRTFTVANQTANTFELAGIDGTAFTTYVSGGTVARVYRLASPYADTDLALVKYTQSADVMYLFSRSFAPRKLSRLGAANWTITTPVFRAGANNVITGISQAATAVVTSAGHTLVNGDVIYISGVVGMTEVNDRWFTVANVAAGTFELSGVNSTAYTAYSSAGVAYKTYFSSANNYPGCGVFHEQRLVVGGTNLEPQSLLGSKINEYEDFTIGTNDEDAYKYTIATDKVNQIRWMISGKILAVGTVGAEFSVGSTDLKESITPTNIKIVRETTHGSADMTPVQVESSVLFVQRARRKVREFIYDYNSDGYVSPDVTILSEHILREGDGAATVVYQEEPDSNIWIPRVDGQVATLTFQKKQEVFGWARQVLGGVDAVVEDIAVIPGEDEDQVWLCVSRTIGGATKKYIEYVAPTFYGSTTAAKKSAVFMDCSVTYSGTATNEVSSLEFLEGETVQVLADGKAVADQVVAEGKINLPSDRTAEIITIGLKCPARIRTMNFDTGNQKGTAQGKVSRITAVTLRVYETLGGKVGHSSLTDAEFEALDYEQEGVTMDDSPDIFTGDLELKHFPTGFTQDPHVEYLNDSPWPVTILSMMPTFQVNG